MKLPSLLMLLLCFAGIASVFLPWIEVAFEQDKTTERVAQFPSVGRDYSRLDDAQLCQADVGRSPALRSIEPGVARVFRGKDLRTGTVLSVCLVLIAALLISIPEQCRVTIPSTLSVLGLSVLATLSVLLAHSEVQSIPFGVSDYLTENSAAVAAQTDRLPGPDALAALSAFQPCALQDSPKDENAWPVVPEGFRQKMTWLPTWFVPIGISAVLFVFSAASVRHACAPQDLAGRPAGYRTDSVIVGQQEAESGLLPDVCMVCGCETQVRVSIKIHHQPAWAQGLMILGFICGGIPGVIIAIMTSKKIRASTPICPDHRNHWNRLVLFASIGWLLPVVLGGIGAIIGMSTHSFVWNDRGGTGLVCGIALGLTLYLWPVIYLACTVVKCEITHKEKITFSRVSSTFARAVRQRQPEASRA